jgi:plasmid maintenance system antidote protein VapI
MHQLKHISKESIPVALEKAERYRLLNEPQLAQSICLDVLEVDPGNAKAIINLLLAITDDFAASLSAGVDHAEELLPRLRSEYEKNYYAGIINERQGMAILNRKITGGNFVAYDWLTKAMGFYEKAEAFRPQGNDDALLRWNTCLRLITSHNLKPNTEEYVEPPLE